jgi:hypothetical protein
MTTADPKLFRRLATDLSAPRQAIEAAFVGVGARLTEGAALLNTLSKLFEALPAALQGAEVEEASAHLKAVAARADQLSETFTQEKADLARLIDVVAAAQSPISDLRRAVKMMGIVSVNARVTAAGIVGDSEDFDVFTTDIASLSDSASRTIQDFANVYRQLTADVDRAASQRAHFEATHADTLSGLAQSLSATLEALDRQRAAALDSSAETGRVSRQIVSRIGSAVMALQIGDSTRQRLEHVETALATMADIAGGSAVFDHSVTADDVPLAIGTFAGLAQGQLSDAASAFADEVQQAERDLLALAADASTIMARSRGFRGDDKGEGSAIASLSAQLRSAVTILADFEAERQKLEAVSTAVQETVRVLLEHVGAVQEIEANMRLVSLNAAVRCAQLGPRGASLTVIAMQLRELTTETVVAAEAAMARLNESASLASAFGTGTNDNGSGQVGQLEQQATLALDILSRLDQHIAAALVRLTGDGPKVVALLENAAGGLSGHARLVEALDDVAMGIAAHANEACPETLPAPLPEIAQALRRTYTMEAERHLHDSFFGQSVMPPAANDAPANDADLSDFML